MNKYPKAEDPEAALRDFSLFLWDLSQKKEGAHMPSSGKKSLMDRFLNTVEVVGNKLPDPVSLFILLALLTVLASALFGAMGVEAVHPGTHKVIKVINLFSLDGFRQMWSKAVSNFSTFAPLAMVLVCVIGAGCAEKSGFLAAFMQKMLGGASKAFVTSCCLPWRASSSSAWGAIPCWASSAPSPAWRRASPPISCSA